jgi:hypothetical protein
MLRALSRLPAVGAQWKAGSEQWDVVASAPPQETAQEDTGMGAVVDVDSLRVGGLSAPCEVDNWDNPMEGEDTVLDDVGSVRVGAEPCMARGQVEAGMDTWEAGGRHSAGWVTKGIHTKW